MLALWMDLDDGSHSDLLFNPLPCCCHGLGWRGRPLISIFTVVDAPIFLGVHGGQVAGPMIEARRITRAIDSPICIIFYNNSILSTNYYKSRVTRRNNGHREGARVDSRRQRGRIWCKRG